MSQHAVWTVVNGITVLTMVDDVPTQAVKGTAGVPGTTDNAAVVAISPNSAPLAVTGAFYQSTQAVSGTVIASAGANLNTSALALESGGNLAAAKLSIDLARDNQTNGSQKTQVTNLPASQAVTGTFFQATQPVSGAFFQATQPISAAALPLPSGASTEATLALIKAKTDNLDVALSTRTKPGDTQPVSGTFWQATQPVSGAFWQATQPVSASALPLPSGAATDASLTNGNLRGSVSVSNMPATQAVTGTFFQTIQPVSAASLPLPSNAAQETTGNLATIAHGQELALVTAMDSRRFALSTRGCDRLSSLFSERGSR